MGRSMRLGVAAAVVALFVAACGGDDNGSATTTPPSSTVPTENTAASPSTTADVAAAPDGGDPCATVPAPEPLAERTSISIAMPVKVQFFNHALLADALGEFEAENIDADIEIAQTPDIVTLLAQGKIDVGAIGLNVGVLNAIAEGVDIRWVGAFNRVQESDLAGFYVRSDWVDDPSTFDVSQLAGAKIGIGVGGRATQQILDVQDVLDRAGLTLDDVTLVELASSDFGSAMKSGAIDAVTAANVQQIIEQGTGVKVAGIAPINAGGYFFSKELVSSQRDVGVAVMRALLRTQCTHLQGDYYSDPAVVAALTSVLEIPEDSVRAQPPMAFDLRIADGSFERLQDAWTAEGDLVQYDTPLTSDQVIDASILAEVSGA